MGWLGRLRFIRDAATSHAPDEVDARLMRRYLVAPDEVDARLLRRHAEARFSGGGLLDGPWSRGGIWGGVDTPTIAPRISRAEALQVPAVLRGRNLIAGTVSTLPLYTYDQNRKRVRTPLLEQIDPDVPNSVTLAQTVEDLIFEGVAWWQIAALGWDGYPVSAKRLDVHAVSMSPPPGYPIHTLPSDMFPGGPVWVMGKPVDSGSLIRFDSPNPALLHHAARAIRRALKLERAADRYADEPQALGFFTPTEGADPAEDEDIDEVLTQWQRSRNTRVTAYVPYALKYNALQWSPADLQLAELQQKATLAIANAMGIDPEDLGVSTTSRTYQNAVDRRQDRINETYQPYIRAITDRLSMGDVTPRGRYVRADLDDFLKADPKSRWEMYATAVGIGGLTVDEVRAEEERPTLPTSAEPIIAPPNVVPERIRQEAPVPSATFDRESGITFDLDETSNHFAVDEGKREITGLVVPFGPTARSGGRQWRFSPGSLKYSDISRVKLLRDHDNSQAVGKATRTWATPEGQWATFKVARGADGDKVLALAADGVTDGFSVGVDFGAGGYAPDPENGAVNVVTSAAWRETSLTAMPSFDDARVSGVTASTPERDLIMSVQAPEQTAPVAPASPDTATFTAAVEAFTAAVERLGAPQEGRQIVRATTSATVREPLTYSLDGRGNSFVRDAWEARKGRFGSNDAEEALSRLRKYEAQTTDLAFSNAGNITDQAQIIPPGYRPDLYVGMVPQGRPLFEAMSRGRIDNANPFKVPVWVGSANLSGTNSEGTGPSTGTITNHTYRTVSPTAQSGEFEITRELVDSANPAIDMIALAAMREEYAQDTEAVIATALAAATDDDTGSGQSTEGCYVYSTIGDGNDLAQEIRLVEGDFPFHRYTVAPNRLLAGPTGWSALLKAVDGMGRPLFPFIGAQNAQGSTGVAAGSLNVDGLSCQPAWSMTSTYNDVVLFNSVDSWAWESSLLSFRFEEKSGPEKIVLNIWGYFAFQILRYTGIHSINYTGA